LIAKLLGFPERSQSRVTAKTPFRPAYGRLGSSMQVTASGDNLSNLPDKDKLLCMRFENGKLFEAEPPAWWVRHMEDTDETEWEASIRKSGAQKIEEIGQTESFTIWKTKEGGYFIDYMDAIESAAWIFIERPADYITFRATYLAPLVQLLRTNELEQEA
jgi:hypothetical protein